MRALLAKLAAVLATGLVFAACNAGAAMAAGEEIGMGRPDAPVKMVEYASASCPHCARFNNEVFPEFKKKYIDTGVVYYEMREVLTDPVNFAAVAFMTARCAGPDKYYSVLDEIFHAQAAMRQTQDYAGGLQKIALAAGLTESQWKACVTDPAAQQALQARLARYRREAEIQGTPTFFLNGTKLDNVYDWATLQPHLPAP